MPGIVVLQYPLKPSLRFAVSLTLLHMIAVIVAFATDIFLAVKLALFLMVSLSLIYYLARDVLLLRPDSWREITHDQSDIAAVVQNGSGFRGQITNMTVVSPYFVVLCVKVEGHFLLASRVIFPDSVSSGRFRELCVHLKFA